MNTIYIKPGKRAVCVTDVDGVTMAEQMDQNSLYDFNVDWLYVAEDDCDVVYILQGERKVKHAKKGNVIIQQYGHSYVKDPVIIVDSKELTDAFEAKKKYNEEKNKCANKGCSSCSPEAKISEEEWSWEVITR